MPFATLSKYGIDNHADRPRKIRKDKLSLIHRKQARGLEQEKNLGL